MQTALLFSVLLRIAILAACVMTHERGHDELHDDAYLELDSQAGHVHPHGEQLPIGYVKYPWQSPQTHVTYPGDDEGLKFTFFYLTIDVVRSIHATQ